jgi:hypothetical protein
LVILRGDEMAELPTDAVNSRCRPAALRRQNRAAPLVPTYYPADIVGKAQRAQDAIRDSGYPGIVS